MKPDILLGISNPGSRISKDISPLPYCFSHPIKKLAYETCNHWQSVTKHRCAIAHHVLEEFALKYSTSQKREQVPTPMIRHARVVRQRLPNVPSKIGYAS